MAQIIGYVKSVEGGSFFIKDVKGQVHQLKSGEAIHNGELVYGDPSNAQNAQLIVDVTLAGTGDLVLSGNAALTFDTSVLAGMFSHHEAVVHVDSVHGAIAAATANDAPTDENADVTNAGETAAGDAVTDTERASDTFANRTGAVGDVTTVLSPTASAVTTPPVTNTVNPVILNTAATAPVNTSPDAIDDPVGINGLIVRGEIVRTGDVSQEVINGEGGSSRSTGTVSIDSWVFHHNGGAFTADVLTEFGDGGFVDINGNTTQQAFDSYIYVVDNSLPGTPSQRIVASNDDGELAGADGSVHDYDSYLSIDNLPAGYYTLYISAYELTEEELDSGINSDVRAGYAGPYQITFSGDLNVISGPTTANAILLNEDTPLTIFPATLLANDTDPEGDPLTIVSVQNGVNGTVALIGGNVVFTPTPDYNGPASFDYTITDGNGGYDTAHVTLAVLPVNDIPTIVTEGTDASGAMVELSGIAEVEGELSSNGVIAFADVDLHDLHTADFQDNGDGYIGTFTLGAIDPVTKEVSWSFAVANSEAEFLAEGEMITQSYTVTVDDGHGGSVNQVVTLTITGTNDQPVVSDINVNGTSSGEVVISETNGLETIFTGILGATDVDATDTHTFEQFGTATVSTDAVKNLSVVVNTDGNYTVDGNFDALAAGEKAIITFQYVANDGNGFDGTDGSNESSISEPKTVTITVTGTNDAPTAVNDYYVIGGVQGEYYGYAEGPDGLNLTNLAQIRAFMSTNVPDATFTPTILNYGDGLDVTSLGFGTNLQKFLGGDAVTLNTDPGNTSDAIISMKGYIETEAGTYNFKVTSDDGYTILIDGIAVATVDSNQSPTETIHESFTLDAGIHQIEIIYWDQMGYHQFKAELSNDGGETYNIVNLTGGMHALVTAEDTPLDIDPFALLVNDTDPDGDTLVVTGVSNPTNGTVVFDEQLGTITFTPDKDYNGGATFDYTISDGNGGTSTATVYLTVTPAYDAPTIVVTTGNPENENDIVYESSLNNGGSNAAGNGEFAYGKFTIGDVEGLSDIKSITLGTTIFAVGAGGLADLIGSTITTSNGKVTLTGYNEGTFDYTFELTSRTYDGVGVETNSFTVKVTDYANMSAQSVVTIVITDDVPTFNDPMDAILSSTQNTVLSGDLNLVIGADTRSALAGFGGQQDAGGFILANVEGKAPQYLTFNDMKLHYVDTVGGKIAVAADGTHVYKVILNLGTGTYQVTMLQTLDNASSGVQLVSSITAGNTDVFTLAGTVFDMQAVAASTTDSTPTVNTNANSMGVSNLFIGANEQLTLSFLEHGTTNETSMTKLVFSTTHLNAGEVLTWSANGGAYSGVVEGDADGKVPFTIDLTNVPGGIDSLVFSAQEGSTYNLVLTSVEGHTSAYNLTTNFQMIAYDSDGDFGGNQNMSVTFDGNSTFVAAPNSSVQGSAGDDTITFATNSVIDGGAGTDTLILGTNSGIDFSALDNGALKNMEVIDLGHGGITDKHSLSNLTLADVIQMTDANNTLTIMGDTSDSVSVKDTGTDTWTKTIGTGADTGFDIYHNGTGDSTVTLKIETAINDTIVH